MSRSNGLFAVLRHHAGGRLACGWLAACTLLAPAQISHAAVVVTPGASLGSLLDGPVTSALRFGVDGAPPGASGAVPNAPEAAGWHWLVAYDEAGNPVSWHRFQVGGAEAASSVRIELAIDDVGPDIRLRWQDAGPLRDAQQVVGPDARTLIDAVDASHVTEWVLLVDERALEDPNAWAVDLPEGRHSVAVRSRDRLDNIALHPQPDLLFDRTPPSVRWERVDARADVPDDVFDGSTAKLRLTAEDAVAGVRRLQSGGATVDGAQLEVSTDQAQLGWQAEDQAGNLGSGVIALRADREGPQLRIRRGDLVLLPPLQLSRSDSVVLEAVDPLAGVAHACVESSIWHGDCRALPITLSGIDPGRYVLKLRGADRIGNRSNTRNEVEVFP